MRTGDPSPTTDAVASGKLARTTRTEPTLEGPASTSPSGIDGGSLGGERVGLALAAGAEPGCVAFTCAAAVPETSEPSAGAQVGATANP